MRGRPCGGSWLFTWYPLLIDVKEDLSVFVSAQA